MDKKTIIKNSKLNNKKDVKVVNKNTSLWIPLSLMIPAIFFLSIWTIIPLIMVFVDSTQSIDNSLYNNAFQQVWSDAYWWAAMKNSLLYAIITVPASLAISVCIAFAISNILREKLRGFWQTVFFIPYVTSSIAVSLTFVHLFNFDYGIINWIFGTDIDWLGTKFKDGFAGLIAIVIFGIWHNLAFEILILTTAMMSIDKRLYDSAAVDGAKSTKTFFNITIPAVEKTIWYLFTIGLIGALKVYPIALFDDSADAMNHGPTLLMYVYDALNNGADYAKAGAASISLIFVVVTFNFLVKKIVVGIQLTTSKVKDNKLKSDINSNRINALRSSSFSNYENEIINKMKELENDLGGDE